MTCRSSLAAGGFGFCPEDLERGFLQEAGGDWIRDDFCT